MNNSVFIAMFLLLMGEAVRKLNYGSKQLN